MLKVKAPGILLPSADLKTEKRIGEAIDAHTEKASRRLTTAEIIAITQIADFNAPDSQVLDF
ncbi:MAG: hypothetical protein AAB787_02860 [Patescibacteria group bacterium]